MTPPNPFTPPGSRVEDRPNRVPGSPVKAVLLGAVVDVAATMAGGIVAGLLFAMGFSALGATREELAELVQPATWSAYLVAMMGIGTAGSALGGYVCARIAKRDEARLGWILAAISVLLGVLMGGDAAAEKFDQLVVGALLTVIGVLVGTKLGEAKNRRAEAGSTAETP